jgi:4,5-dihydroxyphthalate decarboxylase
LTKLQISVAIGNYDRTRPLIDSEVAIDGVTPIYMTLSPEETFFRAFRHAAFDVSELSLSSYVLSVSRGTSDYIAIPAFVSRAFRHSSIYIRTDKGITEPAALKGRRIGLPEWQLTACVWARAILEDEYGVKPSEVNWVRGGVETAGRPEKIEIAMPPGVSIEDAPEDTCLNTMLEKGEIDAFIGPRLPSCFEKGHPHVARLFPDAAVAAAYYQRMKIFPIMHVVGVRRDLAGQHSWLPGALMKAFLRAKEVTETRLADTSAPKVMLPFIEEQLVAARELMGRDYWSYGFGEVNRRVLEFFCDHHHRQGLSERRVAPEELFHPGALEMHSI